MENQEYSRIQVAGIVFSIVNAQDEPDSLPRSSYQSFISTAPPEIIISVSHDGLPQTVFRDSDLIFDSGGAWSLYRIDGQNAIVLGATPPGSVPYKIALFNKDMKQIDIYGQAEELPSGLFHNPLEYPLSEVLMICLLAQGRGLMVHACGIADGDCGYLFLGNSTHGKSTIAKLWSESGITVLNDDRIIVREKDGEFRMYGTPWHGDFNEVSSNALPIRKIFFLKHDEQNSAVPRKGAEAVSMLLTRSFPPLWDQKGMEFTLKFCAELAQKVPCYELGFVPDESVLDFLKD